MNPHLRRWASRLSFSFVIVAAACAWEAYRSYQRHDSAGRIIGLAVVAAILFVLFLSAIKIRHSTQDWREL